MSKWGWITALGLAFATPSFAANSYQSAKHDAKVSAHRAKTTTKRQARKVRKASRRGTRRVRRSVNNARK